MDDFSINAALNNQIIPLAKNVKTGEYQAMVIAPDTLDSKEYAIDFKLMDKAGNTAKTTAVLYVSSAWIVPKTNWVKTDYINIDDIHRIAGNITYLKELAYKMYETFIFGDMGGIKTYSDWPRATEYNAIERNIETMIQSTYPFSHPSMRTYEANMPMPDYNDLNRLEGLTLKIYEILRGQYDGIRHLSFVLGAEDIWQ